MSGSFGPSVNLASPPSLGNVTPNVVNSTNLTNSAIRVSTPGSTQVLTASTTISCIATIIPISSASPITLTSNPQISTGLNGQKVTLVNVGSNAITLVVGNGLLIPSNIVLIGGRSVSFTYLSVYSSWIPDVVIPEPSATSGLLVHVQQNSSVTLTSGQYTKVPFSTEIFDGLGLFSNGDFTPSITGTYKVGFNLYYKVATGSHGLCAASIFQGNTVEKTIFLESTTGPDLIKSGYVALQLTSGTPYHIRAYAEGTSPTIGSGSLYQNSLTIERLV